MFFVQIMEQSMNGFKNNIQNKGHHLLNLMASQTSMT